MSFDLRPMEAACGGGAESLMATSSSGGGAESLLKPVLRKGRATALQTGLNMLNELEGAGLLGIAYTFALAGWASVGCLVAVGLMAGYTGYCLALCMYDGDGIRVRDNYKAVGRACFGTRGEVVVLLTQMSNLLSVGVVYLVLVGSTLSSVYTIADQHDPMWSWLPSANRRVWTSLATLAVMPTVHIGGYRKVSALSAAGTLILLAIVITGISISVRDIVKDGSRGELSATPSLSVIPVSYSIYVFAFSCHGIFPALEASMAHPERFGCVVSTVFASNIVTKALFGLLCFFAFGPATEKVVTSNFSPMPRLIISVLVAANTLLSFPLPLIPVFKALKSARGDTSDAPGSAMCNACERTAVVLLCGSVAVVVPDFGIAMGFMGSLTLPFLTFIFPTVFVVKLHRQRLGAVIVAWSYFVACAGALGGVAGMYANIRLVVDGS